MKRLDKDKSYYLSIKDDIFSLGFTMLRALGIKSGSIFFIIFWKFITIAKEYLSSL